MMNSETSSSTARNGPKSLEKEAFNLNFSMQSASIRMRTYSLLTSAR